MSFGHKQNEDSSTSEESAWLHIVIQRKTSYIKVLNEDLHQNTSRAATLHVWMDRNQPSHKTYEYTLPFYTILLKISHIGSSKIHYLDMCWAFLFYVWIS